MKKNLLELCLSPDLGGLELYMMRAAKALSSDFNVISVININGKLASYYEGTSHQYISLKKSSNLFMLGAAQNLAKIIDDNHIDVIHLHWTKDIPIAVLAKKLSKQNPKLVQTRNMNMTRFKDDFYHRLLYTNIEMMLPVTKRVAEQLKKYIPETVRPKIEVLYMGTPKVKILSEEEIALFRKEQGMAGCFAVGMVGRIEEHKGQHLLIEAIENMEGVELFFVGHEMKEGYIEELKVLAEKRGVHNRVHFLGFMKNPMHFMQACEAMVLATPCETFGLVVIEAMSVGTTMIATKACGPMEIITNERDGLLFHDQDVTELSEKIHRLHRDKKFATELSYQAQQTIKKRFDTEKQFDKLAKILGSL